MKRATTGPQPPEPAAGGSEPGAAPAPAWSGGPGASGDGPSGTGAEGGGSPVGAEGPGSGSPGGPGASGSGSAGGSAPHGAAAGHRAGSGPEAARVPSPRPGAAGVRVRVRVREGDGRPPAARRTTGPGDHGGRTPWLYLAPALVVLGGLLVYPIYQLGLISFLEYTQAQVSGGEPTSFQGFGNYTALFSDGQFWQVLLATVVFAAACVLATLAVGCALAVLLTRVRALPRLALMLAALGAWATPAVTGSTVWVFLFDPDFGPVNKVLGLGDFSWTYGRYSAFALVLLEVVWCSFPFVMVTVYAGIKAIPSEVLEAASLDGASHWRTWRSVTAPMLRPILVVVTIQSVIWDFKVFTQIYVMTNGGGIAGQNLVLNVYAYQKAFASSQYSVGSAIGVVMLLILLAVTLIHLRLLRRQGEEL